MEQYLAHQRDHVFSNVGVLIYVFDIESRDFERDLVTYSSITRALSENSPSATVFCLIHKMDLVKEEFRERLFLERKTLIQEKSGDFRIEDFKTSIWDESLYNAWADIVHTLIPNLEVMEDYLQPLAEMTEAREIVLFEKTTFLVVSSYASDEEKLNPSKDRFERMSSIIKSFKASLS